MLACEEMILLYVHIHIYNELKYTALMYFDFIDTYFKEPILRDQIQQDRFFFKNWLSAISVNNAQSFLSFLVVLSKLKTQFIFLSRL